jgi:hypothetical protein
LPDFTKSMRLLLYKAKHTLIDHGKRTTPMVLILDVRALALLNYIQTRRRQVTVCGADRDRARRFRCCSIIL